MELTTQQTKQVEQYLDNKNFDFIDLKPEILDHIISDIEALMLKNLTFESSFKMTILKWEKHFKETSSFFFGMLYSESKIVVQKAVKLFKPFYFVYLASYFLPTIFLKLVPLKFTAGFVDFINGFLISFSLVMMVYMFFIIIKTIKSKMKTTYRFILKTQYFGLILLIMGLAVGVFNENGEMNPVFTGFVCGGFSVVFICHHFYKKHLKAIQKYKIV
jgi:hypothetical protein